jgi:Purple acid Phosphatase, N-terminal domain
MKRRLVLCVICLICAVLPAAAVLASNSGTVISATVPLVISGVNVSNISSAGATVSWQTNGASNSQVEYGIDTNYGLIATQPSDSTASHTVNLNNLAASTTYHFRARSNAGSLTGVSNDFTFTTLAGNGGETTTTATTNHNHYNYYHDYDINYHYPRHHRKNINHVHNHRIHHDHHRPGDYRHRSDHLDADGGWRNSNHDYTLVSR